MLMEQAATDQQGGERPSPDGSPLANSMRQVPFPLLSPIKLVLVLILIVLFNY